MNTTKSVLFALAGTLFATSASAELVKMWPYKDANWDPDFNLFITAGQFDPAVSGLDTESVTGLQLSLNCPWFGPPVGAIRQNMNYNMVKADGYDLNTFEINPRWYAVDDNLRYGAGPGFGYMWVKPDVGDDASSVTLQLSASVEYTIDKFIIGAGTRYQYTLDQDINGSGDGFNNMLTDIKIGFDF